MSPRLWTLKSRRRLLAFVIFSAVTGACFTLVAYGFLRSSYVQKRIIASIRQPLAELGVEVKFDDFEVDVFAGFNFVNLRLKIDTPPRAKVDVAIKQARLSYGFWALIRQKLELSGATFKGLEGSISLDLPKSQRDQKAEALTLEALVNMIKSPSFTVSIPNVDISDIKLHVALTQGANSTEIDIKETEISSQVSLIPNLFKFKIKASLVASGQHSMSSLSDTTPQSSDTTKIAFKKVSLQPDFLFEIQTAQNQFNLNLQLNKSQLLLDGVSLLSESGLDKNMLHLNLKNLSSRQDLKVMRSGAVNTADGWTALLRGLGTQGQLSLSASGLGIEQKVTAAKKTSSITTNLDQLKLSEKWDFELDNNTDFDRHNWTLDQRVELKNLSAFLSDSGKLSLQEAMLTTVSKVKQGAGDVDFRLGLEKLQHPSLSAPASLEQSGQANLNVPGKAFGVDLITKLNGRKILGVLVSTKDTGSDLDCQLKFATSAPQSIAEVIPASAALGKLGWPEASGTLKLNILHSEPLNQFNMDNWHQLQSSLKSDVLIKPSIPTNPAEQLSFRSAKLTADVSLSKRTPSQKTNKLLAALNMNVDELGHPLLATLTSIHSQNDVNAELGRETSGVFEHKTSTNGDPLITMTTKWTDKPGQMNLSHELLAKASQKLIASLRNPGPLASIGDVTIKSNHKLEVNHRENSVLGINSKNFKSVSAVADLSQVLDQKPDDNGKTLFLVKKPLKIQSLAKLNSGSFDLKTTVDASALAYGKLATVSGVKGDLGTKLNDIREPTKADLDINFAVKTVEFLTTSQGPAAFDRSLKDLTFRAGAALDDDVIAIETLEGGLKDGTIRVSGQGEFKTAGSGQLDGQISSKLLDEKSVISGSGQFLAPFKIILFDKERLSFEANPSFENFSVVVGDFAAKNVNGTITVLEELKLEKDGKIGFLYLKSQNPFARVDYENVEPYVEEKSQLTFDQVSWKHIVVGPMVQSFEIRQNLVLLNDLKMDLLDGSMVGRFYLDLHPSRLRTGFLGRFSGIKPELLKAPDRRSAPKDWAPLAGRMAIDFDMRKRLAAGRMDFTQIGKRQLLSLLDALDPDFKDTQVALARNGLRVAYPRAVGIDMDHGLMDLKIALDGAVSSDVAVRSLPLSALINSQAGEALSTIETMIN